MSLDAYEVRDSQPETIVHTIRFQGGTTAATKTMGPGVTVTYVGTGIVDLIWSDAPGTFVGGVFGFMANPLSGVLGYAAACNDYNPSTRAIRVNIANAAGVLTDLTNVQYLTCVMRFKRTAV